MGGGPLGELVQWADTIAANYVTITIILPCTSKASTLHWKKPIPHQDVHQNSKINS